MNNIKMTVFDIFSFLIPGMNYLLLFVLSLNYIPLNMLFEKISQLSFYSILIIILISYVIGFALYFIASKYLTIFIKIFRKKTLKNRVLDEFNNSLKGIIINDYDYGRLYSFCAIKCVASRDKADDFSALGKMARNLSLGFFIFFVITLMMIFFNSDFILWVFIAKIIVSLFLSIILLLRADDFKSYSHGELLYSYYTQRLLYEGLYYKTDKFCNCSIEKEFSS
jgi:hypothetical protein